MSPELRAMELGRFSEIIDSRRRGGEALYPRAKSDAEDEDWDDEELVDEEDDEDDEDFDDDLDDAEEEAPVERRKHRADDDEY